MVGEAEKARKQDRNQLKRKLPDASTVIGMMEKYGANPNTRVSRRCVGLVARAAERTEMAARLVTKDEVNEGVVQMQ